MIAVFEYLEEERGFLKWFLWAGLEPKVEGTRKQFQARPE